MGTQLNSLEELKEKAKDKTLDCFIRLYGGAKSSKDIKYHTKTNMFSVYHNIDGEMETLTEEEFKKSFCHLALSKGALYEYN